MTRSTRCRALDDQGLYWFEEPTTYNDLRGHAQLARELATPVQLGENFYGPRELWRAIEAHACDYVMPTSCASAECPAGCEPRRSLPPQDSRSPATLYPEVAAHLLLVTETAHWLEWQNWADPLLAEPFELRDGTLVVPDKPGCGIEWDEQAVARYQLD